MTTSALPLRQDALVFGFTTDLSGSDFSFVFYWNQSDNAWYFDLKDANFDALLSGVKVVLGAKMLRGADARLPTGTLLAVDLSDAGVEATSTDLGTRVKVFYVE